jgi:membrane protein
MAERQGRFVKFLSTVIAAPLAVGALRRPPRETPSAANDAPAPRVDAKPAKGIFAWITRSISRFSDDDCPSMAAALAYAAIFSIAPLLLIVIAVAGLAFGRDVVQHQIQTQIQGLIGGGAATQVGAMVEKAGEQSSAGVLSAILGGVAVLIGASGALLQLQSSLDRIWRVKPDPKAGGVKNFIGKRVLSLGMIMAIAFLLMVSLAVSAALAAFGSLASGYLPRGLSAPVLMALGFATSFAVITVLFALMLKFLPDARIDWANVWRGAAVTALLFTIGKYLIGVYLGRSSTASSYGAAGSFVLIVLWLYYSSMIFLFGAELTAVHAGVDAGRTEPKEGAVRVEGDRQGCPRAA